MPQLFFVLALGVVGMFAFVGMVITFGGGGGGWSGGSG
jgi:hypothetical protein